MKMILASKEKFLLERGYDLLGLPREKLHVGIINTAFKASADQAFIDYIGEYYELMTAAGLDFKQFDIEGKTEKEILDFFADRNVIQIVGGSLFYLLKIIRETKFDRILKKLFDQGLAYIGCSAGSYIMCPTIEVGGWKSSRNRYGITDLTALSYVPFLIKCHYTDDLRGEIIEKAKTLKYPLRVLRNDQGFYIEDGRLQFFGNSAEVIL